MKLHLLQSVKGSGRVVPPWLPVIIMLLLFTLAFSASTVSVLSSCKGSHSSLKPKEAELLTCERFFIAWPLSQSDFLSKKETGIIFLSSSQTFVLNRKDWALLSFMTSPSASVQWLFVRFHSLFHLLQPTIAWIIVVHALFHTSFIPLE